MEDQMQNKTILDPVLFSTSQNYRSLPVKRPGLTLCLKNGTDPDTWNPRNLPRLILKMRALWIGLMASAIVLVVLPVSVYADDCHWVTVCDKDGTCHNELKCDRKDN
jgi:hypothetical protein